MRVAVPDDQPFLVLDTSNDRARGFVIRAVDGGITFYLAFGNPQELMNVSTGGVPDGGIPIDSTQPPFPLNFFKDKLFARATSVGFIDIQPFNNG